MKKQRKGLKSVIAIIAVFTMLMSSTALAFASSPETKVLNSTNEYEKGSYEITNVVSVGTDTEGFYELPLYITTAPTKITWLEESLTYVMQGNALPLTSGYDGEIWNDPVPKGAYIVLEKEGRYTISGMGQGAEIAIVQVGGSSTTPTSPSPSPETAPIQPNVDAVSPNANYSAAADTTTNASVPSYKVQKGDTLGKIALNYYGSYKYHSAIYKANAAAFKATGGKLTPGMTLTLPSNIGKGIIAQPVAKTGETLYTVKAGDTLGKIAWNYYKNTAKYKDIFNRNSDRLANPNLIYEGQVIVLPAK